MKQPMYKPRMQLHNLSEEELAKRLMMMIVGIVGLVIIVFGSLIFFAPKIGGLFGFVSRHYNEIEPQTQIAPVPPVFVNAPVATKDESVTLEGLSEPGMTIKLFVNGPEISSMVTDSEGKFTFADVPLIKGKNILFAKAVNEQNIESEKSETVNIEYDNKAPELEVNEPKDGSTVRNLDQRILVTGKVNEKATVRVNNRFAILKPDFTFEILLGVEEGDVEIIIEATDSAGNEKSDKVNIKYVKGS